MKRSLIANAGIVGAVLAGIAIAPVTGNIADKTLGKDRDKIQKSLEQEVEDNIKGNGYRIYNPEITSGTMALPERESAVPHIVPTPMKESPREQNREFSYQDVEKLARMLYGEARGCPKEEKILIAQTALDLFEGRGDLPQKYKNLADMIENSGRYCTFAEKRAKDWRNKINRVRTNFAEYTDKKDWKECLEIAQGIVSGEYQPIKNVLPNYHTSNVDPKWGRTLLARGFERGKIRLSDGKETVHLFYFQ